MGMISKTVKAGALVGVGYALATHSFNALAAQEYLSLAQGYAIDMIHQHTLASSGISLTTIFAMAKTWATLNT